MVRYLITSLLCLFSLDINEKPYILLLGGDHRFISDTLPSRDVAISPAGDEIYYCVYTPDYSYSAILYTKFENGKWTIPDTAPFSKDSRYKFTEPAFNNDRSILYFSSNKPSGRSDEKLNNDIWAVKREGDEWGDPYNIGPPVNTDGGEYFPSFTSDGSMYFTRNTANEVTSYIYKSAYTEGIFNEPVLLPDEINCGTDRYNAFVAPDESFVVVPAEGVEKNVYGANYYIVFRRKEGGWTLPVNMGPKFNTSPGRGWSFSMSPDMKYVFFMATKKENGFSHIYWLESDIIDALKDQITD